MMLILFLTHRMAGIAEGCPACWAGYGTGAERFNKALAELRILYEKERRAALPEIRELLKTTNDPMIQQRALEYIAELKDVESIPLLEDLLSDLTKRVAFTTFGVSLDPGPFQTRLKTAHTLAFLGQIRAADKIWKKYDRMDRARKSEVPYILHALGDPKLNRRLVEIINRSEDHQLMVGALNILAIGGDDKILTFLRTKIFDWEKKKTETKESSNPLTTIQYSVLKIKAEQAVFQIEQRMIH